MIHIEEVNDHFELASYRLLWKSLLAQTRGATFFHSLDWLQTYWKHFGGSQRLRVLVVCSDRQPVGILPLVVRTESTRVGRIRVLTYPLHDWGTFFGPIGPNTTATLTAGLRHIRQTPRDWDMIDLRWVDQEGHDRGRTQRAMKLAGFHACKQGWDQAAVVDLNGTWDEYFRSHTQKWQCNVRRLQRRLAERGKVRLLRYRPQGAAEGDGDPRWDLYDTCVEIAQRSWQGSSTTGTTLCHASVADYFRDAHAAAARTGSLDLNLLLLDETPVAFAYNYRHQGQVYGLRKGFDPAFSSLGPGTVLQSMMLEDSFRRGDRCFDMGAGYPEDKRNWETSIATSYRFTHFPITVARAQLLRVKRWFQERIHGERYVACTAQTASATGV